MERTQGSAVPTKQTISGSCTDEINEQIRRLRTLMSDFELAADNLCGPAPSEVAPPSADKPQSLASVLNGIEADLREINNHGDIVLQRFSDFV